MLLCFSPAVVERDDDPFVLGSSSARREASGILLSGSKDFYIGPADINNQHLHRALGIPSLAAAVLCRESI